MANHKAWMKKSISSETNNKSTGDHNILWKENERKTNDQDLEYNNTGDFLSYICSNSETNPSKTQSNLKKQAIAENIEQIYKSRELNPHIFLDTPNKNTEDNSSNIKTKLKINENNREWLRKSFQRCNESAKSQNIDILTELRKRYNDEDCDVLLKEFGDSKMIKRLTAAHTQDKLSNNAQKSSTSCDLTDAVTNNVSFHERYVTDDEINKMAAQLLKAEMANNTHRVNRLKSNLEKLREAQRRGLKIRVTDNKSISQKSNLSTSETSLPMFLTKTADSGFEIPDYSHSFVHNEEPKYKMRKDKFRTHDSDGRRIAYTYDDTVNKTINEMIQVEKLASSHDNDFEFIKMMGKCRNDVADEYADVFASGSKRVNKTAHYERQCAISQHKRRSNAESNCLNCLEKVPRYLVISTGSHAFLRLPDYTSLSRGHCLLVPFEHSGALTRLPDEVGREIAHFKHQLEKMFIKDKKSVVFMEFGHLPNSYKHHTLIECIPIKNKNIDELKMYFKKSFLELGSDWDQNKRLITLKRGGNGAKGYVPPKFAYFAVEFGTDDGGYARVLDDPASIPDYFGREIIAGVLDKDPKYWRRPKQQNFAELTDKVCSFEKSWADFDIWNTSHLVSKKKNYKDSQLSNSSESEEGPELPPDF